MIKPIPPEKIIIEATIAIAQYENIRPCFEFPSGTSVQEAQDSAEIYIDSFKKRFSDNGELTVRKQKSSIDKIKATGV